MSKKRAMVDLDGTLGNYKGWKGKYHLDPPYPDARRLLEGLNEQGYEVWIFTTRDETVVNVWLDLYGLGSLVEGVTSTKLPATVYVDDRAVPYEGDAEAVLARTKGFLAHWETAK